MAPISIIVSVFVAALQFNTVAGNPEKRSWAAGQLPVSRGRQYTCEPFDQPYCHCFNPADRTHARFPNRRGQNADEAKREFSHFVQPDSNVIKNSCSDKIGTLLCFLYFPHCNPPSHENSNTVDLLQSDDYRLPCRELCEEVRRDCESQFNSSFQWPDHLNCSTLPSSACIYGRDPEQGYDACVRPTPVPEVTPTPQEIIDVSPEDEHVCEPFEQPYCQCFNPSDRTHARFPNPRKQYSNGAQKEFGDFTKRDINVIKSGCSDKIGTLLCFFYFPHCNPPTDSNTAIQPDGQFYSLPCRELCEEVRRDCESQFRDNGMQWPDHLNCSALPSVECISGRDPEQGYDACVNDSNVVGPRTPEPTDHVTTAQPPCDPDSCPTCSLRSNCNSRTFSKNGYTWAAHVRLNGTGTAINGSKAYLVQVLRQYLPDPEQGLVLKNMQIIETTNPECCPDCPNDVQVGGEYLFAGYFKTAPLVWYLEVKSHGGIVSQWKLKYQEELATWIASALARRGK